MGAKAKWMSREDTYLGERRWGCSFRQEPGCEKELEGFNLAYGRQLWAVERNLYCIHRVSAFRIVDGRLELKRDSREGGREEKREAKARERSGVQYTGSTLSQQKNVNFSCTTICMSSRPYEENGQISFPSGGKMG